MKKLLIPLVLLLAVAAAGYWFVNTRLDGLVADLIETEGTAATGTPVDVGGVSIRLADAAASVARLTVGNPEGFGGTAIEFEDFSVQLDPGSLTEDVIVITDVTVTGARLNLLQQGSRTNLRELLANLRQGRGAEADNEANKTRVVIERFALQGASASVSLPDLDEAREVELPTIVLRDIGRASNGATAAQVARQVLVPVIEKTISSAAVRTIRDRLSDAIGDAAGGLMDSLGNALGSDAEEDEQP